MPFTPSHAVVALPFVRTPLVPAAIAVGAMTPDLPLFLRGTPLAYSDTHDLGRLPVTVLVALVLLLVWRTVLRPAARELSPHAVAIRLPAAWDSGARDGLRETFARPAARRVSAAGIALVIASLAIGIATHVVWDLFTHEGRWGSELLPQLDERWGPLTGYKWLQHGSSVIGLMIIAIWGALWIRGRDAAASVDRVCAEWLRVAWWVSLPIVLVAAWMWGMTAFGPFTAEWTIPHLAYRVLPPACAAWGVLTLVLCVAVQIARSTRSRRPDLAAA